MTQDTKALIERLRECKQWTAFSNQGEIEYRLTPEYEAADALEAAQKQIERYEAALRWVEEYADEPPAMIRLRRHARTALTGGGD